MRNLKMTLAKSAAVGALALAGLVASAGSASAQDWSWRQYGEHNVTRCDHDGDTCVVYRCDRDGDDCVRVRTFHRDVDADWRRYGYRQEYRRTDDGRYSWYGASHVVCDADGDHCRRVPN